MGLLFSSPSDIYHIEDEKLGQGSFGKVWRAIDKRSSEFVAIKQLAKNRPGKRQVDSRHEVDMMQRVLHEHILKFIDMWEDATDIYLVLEYCDGGDFSHKLKFCPEQPTGPCEPVVAHWLYQICSAIRALHAAWIVHRDVKPGNFMLCRGVLKLADFGIAMVLPRPDAMLFQRSGTPGFMAPEQLVPPGGVGYSLPVDMWAVGIVLHMMLYGGRNPCSKQGGYCPKATKPNGWNAKTVHSMAGPRVVQSPNSTTTSANDEPVSPKLRKSDGPVSPKWRKSSKEIFGVKATWEASLEAQDLLERLLTSDQHQRATAEEARRHPWLRGRETCLSCQGDRLPL